MRHWKVVIKEVCNPVLLTPELVGDYELDVDDLIDVVNYMTIERNFYRRRSNALEKGDNK